MKYKEINLIQSGMFALAESMDMVALAIKKDSTLCYVNNYFAKLTGYAKEDILGKSWYETFVTEKARANVKRGLETLYIDTSHKDYIYSIIAKNGREIEIDWNNAVIMADNLEMQGIFSIGIEIIPRNKIFFKLKEEKEEYLRHTRELEEKNTFLENSKKAMLNLLEDSKELEEELIIEKRNVEKKIQERTIQLKEEEAKLLSAINSVPMGFAVTDNRGNIILVNNSLEDILERSEKKWTLDKFDKIIDHSVSVYSLFEKCSLDKTPQELNEVTYGKKILSIYVAPVFISEISTEMIGGLILISDITEEKVIERSKDEFVSIASHELRTPLSAIRGNVELLKKYFQNSGNNSKEYTEIINDIHSSTIRLIDLVNDFLTTSRLEQGKIPFKKVVFNPDNIIRETIKELEPNAKKKNVEIVYEKSEDRELNVLADEMRLKEVLINLIDNAIKFTDQGKISVKSQMQGIKLKISVEDTGKGISKEGQNLVFRKFQQANPNIFVRDITQGSGLGLYISKLIIEEMGGKIYLERSAEGEGSSFAFELPLV